MDREWKTMGDVFKEQIVKRKPTPKNTVIRGLLILAVVLVFIVSMTYIPSFGMVIVIIAGFIAYIFPCVGSGFVIGYLRQKIRFV